ncbi:glycerate kinase [Streptomyces sp. NRRL S-920]|uniref:glycerate kinase n=1 Tax=Streptomyces sp. NRRL S-920 TaxID=1463921 RepID=UPI00068F8BEF|nr:glycerate kinase [Streptomyces sp. NRRL S-920]
MSDDGLPALRPDIVIAPNCMRGYATSSQVATALAEGVRGARPHAAIALYPLADGGDGTLDALEAVRGGRRRPAAADDARGRARSTEWLALDPSTAVVETASVCGLGALRPHELDPLEATSRGAGQIVAAAVDAGATSIVIGLGGTAVVDGGAGALAALGARFVDRDGHPVDPRPRTLTSAVAVDLAPARRRLAGVRLRFLADVSTPLSGNLTTFGAQKGVTAHNRPQAVRALHHLVRLLAEAGDPDAPRRFEEPWFGAGGGTGFGLTAVARATAESGATGVLEIADPEDAVGSAPLVLTAEGVVDEGTWQGKLPGAIAQRRAEAGLPTALVAVRVTAPPPEGPMSTHQIARTASRGAVTGPDLWRGLARAAHQACDQWQGTALLEQA